MTWQKLSIFNLQTLYNSATIYSIITTSYITIDISKPMTQQEILAAVRKVIFDKFNGETTGHDFFHIHRVVKNALHIARQESADLFLVELAAWLHEAGDHKFNNGVDCSEEQIRVILAELPVPEAIVSKLVEIVSQVSFSKGLTAKSIEAQVVQDADRLDALGAIGLARVFAYGGSKRNEIYNPDHPANTSIQHFYDKLLLLKDKMNTASGKSMATERHQYMDEFLQRFFSEWNGEGL